jgi:hypothetical protein
MKLSAKNRGFTAVASQLGYTVKRVGKYYTLKEMDSIRIYDKSHWYRWSRQYDKGNNGGSQIDFLRVFCGMDVKEAVFWLLDFAGYRRIPNATEKPKLKYQVPTQKTEERKPFVLPEPSADNSYLYEYLNRDRAIGKAVIDYFVSQGLIYESRHYHNVVFRGNDKAGVTRFASMRGVFDKEGKPFKCDVAGSDKSYGFNIITESEEIAVFEGAIDLLSYVDLYSSFDINLVALGMLSDEPLNTILKEHPNITKIRVCLDNDEPGREAAKKIVNKYRLLGYEVFDFPPREEFKESLFKAYPLSVCLTNLASILNTSIPASLKLFE